MPDTQKIFVGPRERLILEAIGEPGIRGSKQLSQKYANYLRAENYARQFPNGQEANYNLNVPGIQDVIRIPPLESAQLRRERYIRFRDSVSPVPEALQWIAPAINLLDDAQDLLFTALVLARPLLKRLPARLLGPLGWLLLLNDALNLGT